MEKIELLEKLVEVQGMYIELMNDFANLQGSLKSLEEVKNRRIDYLDNTIEGQSEEIGAQAEKIEALEVENAELKKQIAELKKQYEELQKLIPIELVDKEQENQ